MSKYEFIEHSWQNEKGKIKTKILWFVVATVIISIMFIGFAIFDFNDHEYTVTVTDKERISGEDSKYLVFCEDENGKTIVFENTDSLIRLKFNSSDIQGELKIGETYKVIVNGYRVPIFSWYENIIEFEKVEVEDDE